MHATKGKPHHKADQHAQNNKAKNIDICEQQINNTTKKNIRYQATMKEEKTTKYLWGDRGL